MRFKSGLFIAAALAVAACSDNDSTAPAEDAVPAEGSVPQAEELDVAEVVEIEATSEWRAWKPRKATVYVVHGINGKDLGLEEDALPVDVSLNGDCAIQNFTFRTITDAVRLPVGKYDIRVHLGGGSNCAGDVAIEVLGAEDPPRSNSRATPIAPDSPACGCTRMRAPGTRSRMKSTCALTAASLRCVPPWRMNARPSLARLGSPTT